MAVKQSERKQRQITSTVRLLCIALEVEWRADAILIAQVPGNGLDKGFIMTNPNYRWVIGRSGSSLRMRRHWRIVLAAGVSRTHDSGDGLVSFGRIERDDDWFLSQGRR
jgi:hypothetical protein